jgi:hypothetical protein
MPRASASGLRWTIRVDDQGHPRRGGERVAQRVELGELPAGVDVEQREGRPRGEEALAREMEHDAAVLAAGEEHHRPCRLGGALADDLDRFRFQAVEMVARQSLRSSRFCARVVPGERRARQHHSAAAVRTRRIVPQAICWLRAGMNAVSAKSCARARS